MGHELAPITLFVYNRPEHTQVTIEALAKNELASKSKLYIFSDGWKSENDRPKVEEVRNYLKTITGFLNVGVIERDHNYGLADSIVDGVTNIVNKYGRVIVLEDDIVTTKFFLQYMNDALEKYCNEERVMHVAAHIPPINIKGLEESFFLRQSSCWGWATWRRAWEYFDRDGQKYINSFCSKDIKRFNLNGSYDYWSQLSANEQGRLKTWAVYWYASIFNCGGLCLHPRVSLVNNIGFDGSGENCGTNAQWYSSIVENRVSIFPDVISENKIASSRIQNFITGSLRKKIILKCKKFYKKFRSSGNRSGNDKFF